MPSAFPHRLLWVTELYPILSHLYNYLVLLWIAILLSSEMNAQASSLFTLPLTLFTLATESIFFV